MLLGSLLKTLKYAAYLLIFGVAITAFMILGVWSIHHHPFAFVGIIFVVLIALGTLLNYEDAKLEAKKRERQK